MLTNTGEETASARRAAAAVLTALPPILAHKRQLKRESLVFPFRFGNSIPVRQSMSRAVSNGCQLRSHDGKNATHDQPFLYIVNEQLTSGLWTVTKRGCLILNKKALMPHLSEDYRGRYHNP